MDDGLLVGFSLFMRVKHVRARAATQAQAEINIPVTAIEVIIPVNAGLLDMPRTSSKKGK
jgi:hypothetical protein